MTRRGQLVAECASVERCFQVNLLRRRRRVVGEMGEEAKGWEEVIVLPGVEVVITSSWWVDGEVLVLDRLGAGGGEDSQ